MRTFSCFSLLFVGACGAAPVGDGGQKAAAPGCWFGYPDADGDGFGDVAGQVELCEGDDASAFVSDASDCNDGDAGVYVGAPERCNGVDDDCDGTVDGPGADEGTVWYADADGDGYGDSATATVACDAPTGAVADASDCNDGDGAVYPGGLDVCGDGIDGDCDGYADEGVAYAYWAEVFDTTLAAGESGLWSVVGCAPGGEGCPGISFGRAAGPTTVGTFGGSGSFAAGGEIPGDVVWEGGLPRFGVDDAVDGTVTFGFTPASAFETEGLRVVVGVMGTGGPGQGPLRLTADQDLTPLGALDLEGGEAPVFAPPDSVFGSADGALADDLLFFAVDPASSSLTLTLTDGGAAPDAHAYTIGYVLFTPCEG
jgi:hypothetical protein